MMKQDSYTCKKCKDRNDPNYFIKNNMHPLWYEIEDDGSFQMDSNGKKIPRFDRPHELLRLSMAEKLLIQFKDVLILCHQFIYQMGPLH